MGDALEDFYRQVTPAGYRVGYTVERKSRLYDHSVHPQTLASLLEKNRNNNQYLWWEAPEPLEKDDDDIRELPRNPDKRTQGMRGLCQAICLDFDLCDPYKTQTKNLCRDTDALLAYIDQAIRDGVIARPNFVVASGSGGRHLWYTLHNPLSCEQWMQLVKQLFTELKARAVPFDPKVGNKPHQLIRAPGSYNCKKRPVLVSIEKDKDSPYSITRLSRAWRIAFDVQSASTIYQQAADAEEQSKDDLPPIATDMSPKALAHGCRTAALAILNAEGTGTTGLNYDQWLALCSIARHIKDGSALLHRASRCHSNYDAALTEQKLGDAGVGHVGPLACSSLIADPLTPSSQLLEIAKEKCGACSAISRMESNRTTYPLLQIQKFEEALGPREAPKFPMASPSTDSAPSTEPSTMPSLAQHAATMTEYALPQIPWGFVVQPKNLPPAKQRWVWMPDPQKPDEKKTATDSLWAITSRLNDESGSISYKISTAAGRCTVAPAESLNDMRSLAKVLSDVGVAIVDRGYTGKLFQALARQCTESETTYAALGWKSKRQFVTYNSVITSSAEYPATFAENAQDDKFQRDHGTRAGTLDGWQQAIQRALAPEAEPMAFALFYALGSVLVEPLKLNGNVGILSLYSPDSGTGKTTCLKLASSIFGAPQASHCGYGDTALSIAHRMGYMKHLPVCVDELTMLDTETLRNFIYHTVAGMGKRGLTADNKQREVRDWNLSTLCSTNESMWHLLGGKQKAAMDRVFEVRLDKPILSVADADEMLDNLLDNHGVVGVAFVQHLQQTDWAALRRDYTAINNALRSKMRYRTDDRFVTHALALAVLAARVARDVPGMDVSDRFMKRLFKWCCEVSNDSSTARKQISRDAMLSPDDLYRYVQPNLLRTDGQPYVAGSGECSADQVSWADGEYLYARRATITRWLNDLRTDAKWPSLVSAWEHKGLAESRTVRIRVTEYGATRQVSVYKVRMPS